MMEDRFPQIRVPSWENRDIVREAILRQLCRR
jgi:hypothetical protein